MAGKRKISDKENQGPQENASVAKKRRTTKVAAAAEMATAAAAAVSTAAAASAKVDDDEEEMTVDVGGEPQPQQVLTNISNSTAAQAQTPQTRTKKAIARTTAKAVATAAATATAVAQRDPVPSAHEIEQCFKVLNECLKKVAKSGNYAVDGEAHEMPKVVGLEVKNFGLVGLPFTDPQASKLIEICKQSPYGHNEKTLIDRNVRDSYQLEPSEVKITNPEWNTKLNELVARVGKSLGCQTKIEAKLYKTLVYKKGGHFLKHRDTEKEKGMFGTLIVQLPSLHTGGELVVYENNGISRKVIDFGQKEKKSEFSIYFAAHYADLEHELLEIKSGYRLALVYSLCWVKGNGSLISNESISSELVPAIEKLNRKPYQLGIILEHQYTTSSFRENGKMALKGVDADRMRLLDAVNSRLAHDKQLVFHLCEAALFVYYNDYGAIDSDEEDPTPQWEEDKEERRTELKWYDMSGEEAFNNYEIDIEFFTKVFNPSHKTAQEVDLSNQKEWGKHVDEDIDGYRGNEGLTKTTEYNRYLLVVWPRRFEFDSLLRIDVHAGVDSLYKQAFGGKDGEAGGKIDAERLDYLLGFLNEHKKMLLDEACVKCIKMLIAIKELTYVEKFLGGALKITWSKEVAQQMAKLIACFGLVGSIKKFLSSFLKSVTVEDISRNCQFIECLCRENQPEAGRYYFDELLNKLIDNSKNFEKIVEITITNPETQVNLVKCIQLFPDKSSVLDTLKTKTLELMNKNETESYPRLFNAYLMSKETLEKCSPIVEMFEARRKWLKEVKLKNVPEFTWAMPEAKIDGHPRVLSFLQSNQERMIYAAPFRYVKDMRSFIEKYQHCREWDKTCAGYSVRMIELPSKSVLIQKTRNWFDAKNAANIKFAKELESINKFLNLAE